MISASHKLNTHLPISTTLSGIVTDFNFEHFPKARSPIILTFLGTLYSVTFGEMLIRIP